MAYTDQIVNQGEAIWQMSRWNIWSFTDAISLRHIQELFLTVPVIADVKSGIQYWQQWVEKTGTYVWWSWWWETSYVF